MTAHNDFEAEIEPLKKQIMEIANRWGNVQKFELHIDYEYVTSVSIVDYKHDDAKQKQGEVDEKC